MRLAPTFAALCSDRTLNTVEQIVSPTGYKFNVTTSTCISPSTPDKRAMDLGTRSESVVDKRSASECTTTDCVCGTACKLSFEYYLKDQNHKILINLLSFERYHSMFHESHCT